MAIFIPDLVIDHFMQTQKADWTGPGINTNKEAYDQALIFQIRLLSRHKIF